MGINPLWSHSEERIVLNMYSSEKSAVILSSLPGRTWDGVKHRARKLGIARIGRPDRRSANYSLLLLDKLESYYWMGFICADGFFSGCRYLGLTLGQKDLGHLKKFVKYVQGDISRIRKTTKGLYEFKSGDDFIIPQIQSKFDLRQNKTLYPPAIMPVEDEWFLSFLVGFIDGDGCICFQTGRKDCTMRIGIHGNWFHFLVELEKRLFHVFQYTGTRYKSLVRYRYVKTTFGNSRIAQMDIHRRELLVGLNDFIQINNLPVLKRKWGKLKWLTNI